MGHKVNPIGFRIGVTKEHLSVWYSSKKEMSKFLEEDAMVRSYLEKRLDSAAVSGIKIDKTPTKIEVTISTARPGLVIGKKGQEIENLKNEIKKLVSEDEVKLNVKEIRVPELDAHLVGKNIAALIEKRMPFRRVMKRTIYNSMKMGAKGIKIRLSGRLGGADMARQEIAREGRVPLQTLTSDIDFAIIKARTIWGVIGVKVWICKGQIKRKRNKTLKPENA